MVFAVVSKRLSITLKKHVVILPSAGGEAVTHQLRLTSRSTIFFLIEIKRPSIYFENLVWFYSQTAFIKSSMQT